MRRASASFDGLHLNIHLKNDVGGAAVLYECTFNSGEILVSEPVVGRPSVYRLRLDTSSGSYSESLFSTDIPNDIGRPVGGPDPIARRYILPAGVVSPLTDPWADPETL